MVICNIFRESRIVFLRIQSHNISLIIVKRKFVGSYPVVNFALFKINICL